MQERSIDELMRYWSLALQLKLLMVLLWPYKLVNSRLFWKMGVLTTEIIVSWLASASLVPRVL